jgi:hypothetical protein
MLEGTVWFLAFCLLGNLTQQENYSVSRFWIDDVSAHLLQDINLDVPVLLTVNMDDLVKRINAEI